MTTKVTTVLLQLPFSLQSAVEKLVAAEKLAAIETAVEFFVERWEKEDPGAAVRFLIRTAAKHRGWVMNWWSNVRNRR